MRNGRVWTPGRFRNPVLPRVKEFSQVPTIGAIQGDKSSRNYHRVLERIATSSGMQQLLTAQFGSSWSYDRENDVWLIKDASAPNTVTAVSRSGRTCTWACTWGSSL